VLAALRLDILPVPGDVSVTSHDAQPSPGALRGVGDGSRIGVTERPGPVRFGREIAMSRFGATILRVVLGIIFVLHGYLGLFVLKPAGTAGMITLIGLPLGRILAWYLILAHVVGGLMMVAGLWTRWAALANVPVMLVALLRSHIGQSFFMTAVVADAAAGTARVVGLEYPLLVLAATLTLVLLGGGALAMTDDDRW
jgi:putative oxidoreductase